MTNRTPAPAAREDLDLTRAERDALLADMLSMADVAHDLLRRYDELYGLVDGYAATRGDPMQGDIFNAALTEIGYDELHYVLASVHSWIDAAVGCERSYGDDPAALRALCQP